MTESWLKEKLDKCKTEYTEIEVVGIVTPKTTIKVLDLSAKVTLGRFILELKEEWIWWYNDLMI